MYHYCDVVLPGVLSSHLVSESLEVFISRYRLVEEPLLEFQIVQTILAILHCEQFEQNGIIAACPSSWNYSVTEGCGWVVLLSVADLEGVPWVPWNPSFEELHGFENTMHKHTMPTLLPPQLGMVICYQYESTYFPAPYADNQLFCSLLWAEAESHL